MAFWAKTVDIGAIESFKCPDNYGLILKGASLSDPSLSDTVTLYVTTINYDDSVVTVPVAHLSKKNPQVVLDMVFSDDRVKFSALASGEHQPEGFVALTGVIDGIAPAMVVGEAESSEEDSSAEESSATDESDEEEQYVLQAAEASSSDTSSSSESDSDSTSEDSGAEDEDALALAYIGDDASGNPQLMTGDGSLFSVVQGEEEDGDGEQSLYLVETGHVEAASESDASESSESGEESSDEEADMAFPHGPVYVMSPPATDVQSSPVSGRRSAKRRRSGAALTPRSKSKRAALELDL